MTELEQFRADLDDTRVAIARLTFLVRERRFLSPQQADVVLELLGEVQPPDQALAAASGPAPMLSDLLGDVRPRRRPVSTRAEDGEVVSTRSQVARIASHTRWAKETDRSAATQPARDGLMTRFEREVDPDGVLPLAERAARAESARRAYYQRLARKSARARRRST